VSGLLPEGHRLVSLAERPDLRDALNDHNGAVWPEFMLHDPVADHLWHHLDEDFPAFQLILLDAADVIVGTANSAPLHWDGTDAGLPDGWDDQMQRSVAGLLDGTPPDTLGAIQIVVNPRRQGSQLSGVMLAAMRSVGSEHGYGALVACVRPTLKHRYPTTPIERFARWTREDGLPFDPWIRLHVRMGGRIVRASPESMTMRGTVAEWSSWTGMDFPESGDYIVPVAADVVHIDREADLGVYHDPNVWVVHELTVGD
jgi:hypothetical protein